MRFYHEHLYQININCERESLVEFIKMSSQNNGKGEILTSYWFSRNPNKAWGEKFYLIYSPIWIVITGIFILIGLPEWGNWGQLGFCCLVIVPMIAIPTYLGTKEVKKEEKKWYEAYWLKFHIWIWIFALWGGYFFNEYWFDILGAHYYLPNVTWNIDPVLIGLGSGTTPITMFLLAVPYLTTYHVTAVIIIRKVRTWVKSHYSNRNLEFIIFVLVVVVTAFFWAFAETIVMTNVLPSTYFGFANLRKMLTLGTVIYACYYFVTFPLVYMIDEQKEDDWSIMRVVLESFAAGMIIFFIFEFWARIIGPIYI